MPLESYLEQQRERHLEELLELLRIPSVSSDPELKADVARAAGFLQDRFRELGFETRIHETPGHPVVVAKRSVSPDAPTVLIYGHYDVQPPDPLELWERPPFEPEVVDGAIHARGASDDKGQLYAHVKGVEAALESDPELPLNITFLIEGEEEISSPNLAPFLREHREELAADVVLISDGAMLGPNEPSLTYGLRGMAYLELRVRAAARDLHSGAYGGAVPNSINVLSGIIAALHDDKGRVAVPGFYDRVRELTDDERSSLASLPFDEKDYLGGVGVDVPWGEEGYSVVERLWARPTLDVNGIWGGFQGEGSKTVIAAEARAKISCRLVPDQDPQDIFRLLEDYLPTLAPKGVEVEVRRLNEGSPAVVPLDSRALAVAGEAIEAVWGKKPAFVRTGGSIPIVSEFQQELGADVILLDMGLETDQLHAPNEHFQLRNYYRGIHVSAEVLARLARH